MEESGDVREHIDMFFHAVDKLQEMEVEINRDLLAIMLLYGLPDSFENFRCAIESRDHLPTPDVFPVKIIEESNARKTAARGASQNALFSNHKANWRKKNVKKTEKTTNGRTRNPVPRTTVEISNIGATSAKKSDIKQLTARTKTSVPPRKVQKILA
jgi:hypothetical protein